MKQPEENSTIATIAGQLLKVKDLGIVTAIEPLAGGRNNRTFRIAGSAGQWLLKQYFPGTKGGRDRCSSEWDWCKFCWEQGVKWTPEPIQCDNDQHCSLFEFIQGRHLRRDEIDLRYVEQAAAFVTDVNRARSVAAAASLPDAAEACFSIQQHLDCVERRILRLRMLPVSDALDADLQDWLIASLFPAWQTILRKLTVETEAAEISRELATTDRCLSPSDFGFHNALLTSSGQLRFLDFEYAGWDDPAKLVCDFFWQQDLPAGRAGQANLISALSDHDSRHALEHRVRWLTPVYGIKWCCLVLNEFVAEDRDRREFAQSAPVTNDRRAGQFSLAKKLLADVQTLTPPVN